MDRIVVKNVSKRFRKDALPTSTLSKIISFLSRNNSKERFFVLDNVSFRVREGEVVGLVGENGSGKSTLLRIVAGIYQPTLGEVVTKGKIVSLIDLSSALQPTMTMEDGIYLCSSFLEVGREEIRAKFPDIVEFSGLDDFMNTRIYKFSSGMVSRLVFSVAVNCNPEILLLDEVFAVGDEQFKRKSTKKIRELVQGGCSVLLAGHELELMQHQCDRAIWLEKGRVLLDGKPKRVIETYRALSR